MAEDDWALLQADIPLVLYPDWDDDGEIRWPQADESVQLYDTASGQRILFCPDGKGIGITVSVPDDRGAAAQLRAVLQSQRTASLSLVRDYETGGMRPMEQAVWEPLPGSARAVEEDGRVGERSDGPAELAREWRTGWRHNAAYRDEIAAAIVAVLRDGLGSRPADLRVCAFNNEGPTEPPRLGTVVPDRPTKRGAPAQCSSWDDLADRVRWVLTTLPLLGYLDLSVPGTPLSIQLSKSGNAHLVRGVFWNEKQSGPGSQELQDRMITLGWQWGAMNWNTPKARSGTANPTVRSLTVVTIATLRTICEAADPNILVSRGFVNGAPALELPYVATELGLAQA